MATFACKWCHCNWFACDSKDWCLGSDCPMKMRNYINTVRVWDWGIHFDSFILRLLTGLLSCLLSTWAVPEAVTDSSFAYAIFRNCLKTVEDSKKHCLYTVYFVNWRKHITFSRQNKPAKQVLNVCLPKRHNLTSWMDLTGDIKSAWIVLWILKVESLTPKHRGLDFL